MKVMKYCVDGDADMSQEQFDEWVGAHDVYAFDFGEIKIRANSYKETPNKVSIGWYEKNGSRKQLDNTLIEESEFLQALRYLKELNIYEKYCFFNGSYPVIPSSIWKKLEST
jgi:hypothetical protein